MPCFQTEGIKKTLNSCWDVDNTFELDPHFISSLLQPINVFGESAFY